MIHIYRGPWQWITEGPQSYWSVPWASGCLDCRSVVEQSQAGGSPGVGIFSSRVPISDSNYDLLGTGNWHDIKPDQRVKDAIPAPRGYRVKGDDLVGMLLDLFTAGADPEGSEFAKPLMPTVRGRLELHLGGRKHSERFRWGSPATAKIQHVIRGDFRRIVAAVDGGQLPPEHHRRVLDYWCDKYHVDDWREFAPQDLQARIPGRLKHATTLQESFDTADSATLGPNYSWTDLTGDIGVVSNAAEAITNDASFGARSRADSDLSGADHYAQAVLLNPTASTATFTVFCRKDSTTTKDWYQVDCITGGTWRTVKASGGTYTVIGTNTTGETAADNDVLKVETDGSTIRRYRNGGLQDETTDATITGNLRGGIGNYWTGGTKPRMDSWEAADLTGGGITITQLQALNRGITRGIYTRF